MPHVTIDKGWNQKLEISILPVDILSEYSHSSPDVSASLPCEAAAIDKLSPRRACHVEAVLYRQSRQGHRAFQTPNQHDSAENPSCRISKGLERLLVALAAVERAGSYVVSRNSTLLLPSTHNPFIICPHILLQLI
jgi:hypothetical protein